MKLLALFLWINVPMGLWLAVWLWGTPHALWTFRYVDPGNPYSTAPRRHIDCTYLSWTGSRTAPAVAERCPWIRFFKPEAG
ncbi:MAG: hypothetical protein AAFU49_12945 [Pseudomonadota bacterium]